MKTVVIAANAVKARLITDDRQARLDVSALLSFLVEGYEHTDSFKNTSWDGRSSFFEFSTGFFPAGFVSAVETQLAQRGYRVLVKRKARPAPLGPSIRDAYDAVNPFDYDPRYSYQLESVRRLEKYGHMVAQVATGGGKSMIARTAVKRIGQPSLFLTTRKVLMHQMKDGFDEAGIKTGVMGDGEWSPVRGNNVAMVQTIMAKLNNPETAPKMRRILGIFGLAILEEAHEAGGNGYFEIMNHMTSAYYRLALTGTPFMRADGEADMRLMAVSGQVGIKVTEKLLIDRGILAKPLFIFRKTPPSPALKRYSGYQKAVDVGIVNHEGRNQEVTDFALEAAEYGLNGMVLVQRRKHGDNLVKMMRAAGLRVKFIFGDHGQDQRKRALDMLGRGELDVLIGSTILDVGVDVPSVGYVVNAGGGKAEIALRQRIGRGLRAKKRGPNVCFILEFEDQGNRYLKDHARHRRQIIEATPGFAEGVLTSEKFPFGNLGFSKAT